MVMFTESPMPLLSKVSRNIVEISLELENIDREIVAMEGCITGLLNRKWNLELRLELLREQER